ncbi:MAG: carbamate kinase [Thermoplasmata archaeon]|nr:MAG: carbamate kinase [Thermoplasmata archaeon]
MNRAVIALGGNALIKPGQRGTAKEQFENVKASLRFVADMIIRNWEIVITHGNGPQVGSILLQNQAGRELTPPMPLDICVAESQGLIGYMIQQSLRGILMERGIDKDVVTVITQVIVDEKDDAFKNPTKPVGPTYDEKQAMDLLKDGYRITKVSGGWRIVVPSPDPKGVVESRVIKALLEKGFIVIAAGGGGIPVTRSGKTFYGKEAVIDKDLAAERIATSIGADLLFILTNVPFVYINYGKEDQKELREVKLGEIEKYYMEGQFPPGSMGPKVLAAIRFLRGGGKKVIISDIDHGLDALEGRIGTHITR